MRAMDRHKMRVHELLDSEPVEGGEHLYGVASEDVKTYLPLATGLVTELTATELKKKEAREAEEKLKSSEGYKAQQAAADARKRAEMAKAEAVTESDPNGPKHKAAAQLELEAMAAEQKARYFASLSTANVLPGAAGGPSGGYAPGGGGSDLFSTRNLMIGGAILGGVVVLAMVMRR